MKQPVKSGKQLKNIETAAKPIETIETSSLQPVKSGMQPRRDSPKTRGIISRNDLRSSTSKRNESRPLITSKQIETRSENVDVISLPDTDDDENN